MFRPPSPSDTPQNLFPLTRVPMNDHFVNMHFVNQANQNEILIFPDGACINNGQAKPRAGWGFVVHSGFSRTTGYICGQLEEYGPMGKPGKQTNNRAELRAVIAALQYRRWSKASWHSIVFATDSKYVALGATDYIRTWAVNGWKTHHGKDVKNRDLWEELCQEVLSYQADGTDISFWRIDRSLNEMADRAAKEGIHFDPPVAMHCGIAQVY